MVTPHCGRQAPLGGMTVTSAGPGSDIASRLPALRPMRWLRHSLKRIWPDGIWRQALSAWRRRSAKRLPATGSPRRSTIIRADYYVDIDMGAGGRLDCGVSAAVDVQYLRTGGARAAAVLAADAAFAHVLGERTAMVPQEPPYRPGEFYLREFPPLRGPGRSERAGPAGGRWLRRSGPQRPGTPLPGIKETGSKDETGTSANGRG